MGQKVSPVVLRIGLIRDWSSKWFVSKKVFPKLVYEDYKIRELVKKNYPPATIAEIIIERLTPESIKIRIRTSRPGVVIGRGGRDIERVREEIQELTQKEVYIEVEEVSNPAVEALLVAENIVFQLEKRVNHRRAMKRAIQMCMLAGAKGVKIRCSGRLAGAEIARSEIYKEGKIPLSSFRCDIDYACSVAKTRYGTIGVKVWIYKGEKDKGAYVKKVESQKEEEES